MRHDEVDLIALDASVTFKQSIPALEEETLRKGFTQRTDLVSKGHLDNVPEACDRFV